MTLGNDPDIDDLKDRVDAIEDKVKAIEDFLSDHEVEESLGGLQWATGQLVERVLKLETAGELFGCLLMDIVNSVPTIIRQVMVGMTRKFLPNFPSNDGLVVDLRAVLLRLTPRPPR